MKNGKYKMTLEVELRGLDDTEEAAKAVADMIVEMHENEEMPEGVVFELLEEFEPDYEVEENDGVEELDFDNAS